MRVWDLVPKVAQKTIISCFFYHNNAEIKAITAMLYNVSRMIFDWLQDSLIFWKSAKPLLFPIIKPIASGIIISSILLIVSNDYLYSIFFFAYLLPFIFMFFPLTVSDIFFYCFFFLYYHRLDVEKVVSDQASLESKELAVLTVSLFFVCFAILKLVLAKFFTFFGAWQSDKICQTSRGWVLILVSSSMTIFITLIYH